MNTKPLFSYRLPAVLGLAHGVSDGAAGLLLGSLATHSPATQITLLVLVYNALAFGGQPLIGYFADSLRSPRLFVSGSMALMAAGLVTRWLGFGEAAVLMAGLASAGFHVGAGALTLRSCGGRSDAAGLFAAPGVIGLAIGGALAVSGHYLYLPFLILLVALLILIQAWPVPPRLPSDSKPSKEPIFEAHNCIMIALLTAVALRSLLWTSFQLATAGQINALIALGVAAGLGTVIGGFAAERLGYRRWTLLSLLIAAPLLAFAGKKLAVISLLSPKASQKPHQRLLICLLQLLPKTWHLPLDTIRDNPFDSFIGFSQAMQIWSFVTGGVVGVTMGTINRKQFLAVSHDRCELSRIARGRLGSRLFNSGSH